MGGGTTTPDTDGSSGLPALSALYDGGAAVPAQPVAEPVEKPTAPPGPGPRPRPPVDRLSSAATPVRSGRRRHGDRGRLARRVRRAGYVVGELMITAGVVVVLFIVYQLWVTGLFQARTQDRLRGELARSWSGPQPGQQARSAVPEVPDVSKVPSPGVPSKADTSGALAVLHVPTFGAGYAPVVVEGVSVEDLKLGPGHYPGTALPGEVGNFVVSGHRTTYGAPFARLDELRAGDPIVVEVRDRYFTYRVTRSEVVSPNRVDVVLPVPGQPDAAPKKSLMTFTTCHPKFSAASRLVVFAELAATRPKSAGPPPELGG